MFTASSPSSCSPFSRRGCMKTRSGKREGGREGRKKARRRWERRREGEGEAGGGGVKEMKYSREGREMREGKD